MARILIPSTALFLKSWTSFLYTLLVASRFGGLAVSCRKLSLHTFILARCDHGPTPILHFLSTSGSPQTESMRSERRTANTKHGQSPPKSFSGTDTVNLNAPFLQRSTRYRCCFEAR